MKKEEIESIVKKQRKFFDSGKTHNTEFRINSLKKLRFTIKKYENEICAALYVRSGTCFKRNFIHD